MNILALDAACGQAAAVILKGDGALIEAESQGDKPHSLGILPLLESILGEAELGWGDLDLLAVGMGPGSFTGLRIAIATMAGINASLRLPMLGISSLAITALQSQSDSLIWVLEDVRSGDAYVGCYVNGVARKKDQCLPWNRVSRMPAGNFTGHGKPPVDLPAWHYIPLKTGRARALGKAVQTSISSVDPDHLSRLVLPSYLRPSQAERVAGGQLTSAAQPRKTEGSML
jgi:tRNA threonylcarbamoyl adenosine modification protein YeaZ